MRPRRSDSTTGPAAKSLPTSDVEEDEAAPDLKAESEDVTSSEEMQNKNPVSAPEKRAKTASFSPPPALSPAHSIQMENEEIEVKMEVDSDEEEKKLPKITEKRAKMVYKKKPEKEKEAVPFIDPNAPKRNRSGYVHFIIHRRASYSKAVMSQREINISLAADWQKLTAEERIPFQQRADEEKVKYLELMEEYKKTDSHKEFQKKRAKFLSSQSNGSKNAKKRRQADSDDDTPNVQIPFPKPSVFCPLLSPEPATSSSTSGLQYSGPIFTPEFMTYNKTRDTYRRQLAIERSHVEHELEALHQHDMDVRIEQQETRIREADEKIEETMAKMRTVLAAVPGAKDHLTSIDALATWLESLTHLGAQNSTKKSVKEAVNKNAKSIVQMKK